MDEVFRKSLRSNLYRLSNACPGRCQDAEKIEYMKQQFSMLEFDQLTTQIKEVKAIDRRLVKHNKNISEKDLEDAPPAR